MLVQITMMIRRIAVVVMALAAVTALALRAPEAQEQPQRTSATASFEWDYNFELSPEVSQFVLYYGLNPNPTNFSVVIGRLTNHTIGGLLPGRKYHASIVAVTPSSESARGDEITFIAKLPRNLGLVPQKISVTDR